MYASQPNEKSDLQAHVVNGVPATGYTHQNQNDHQTHAHALHGHQQTEGPWSVGLCDCCSDCSTCCLTCWCPCITFGRIAEIVDKGSSSCGVNGALYCIISALLGCPCCYSCFYRTKMRKQYNLSNSPCGDCLVHFCRESCALCQEHSELKSRGFDMSLGWQGNLERQQNRGVGMAPLAPIVEDGTRR